MLFAHPTITIKKTLNTTTPRSHAVAASQTDRPNYEHLFDIATARKRESGQGVHARRPGQASTAAAAASPDPLHPQAQAP